jgi:hypothetical protein
MRQTEKKLGQRKNLCVCKEGGGEVNLSITFFFLFLFKFRSDVDNVRKHHNRGGGGAKTRLGSNPITINFINYTQSGRSRIELTHNFITLQFCRLKKRGKIEHHHHPILIATH